MDDIFEDDISMGIGQSGLVQSPLNISLHPSQSATSLTGESPQTAAATLFRPPQPRNTPAATSARPAAAAHTVKKYADLLKLSKENQDVLQKMYQITLQGEEHLATLAYLVFSFQEGKSGVTGPKWVPDKVIRDTFKDAVSGFMFRPDLQAFSKTMAGDHTTMLQSLEVLTFNYVKGLDPDFVDEHCPGDYSAGEPCIPATPMYLFIKETLKNQRSKVRSVLLTNILGVPEVSVAGNILVPSAKSLVLQVARVFMPEARSLGDKDTLTKLGREKVKWIIFMRYVTVWYHLNHTVNKKRCQWTVMDEVLADLRARPETDRALYFDRVVRYERNVFDGKRSWATMKAAGQHLLSPVVEDVLAPPGENDAHALGLSHVDALVASGSGEAGIEEGGEEGGEEELAMMT